MNFSSWPDEFRPTKSREPSKGTFLSISFSLSLYAQKLGNWEILSQMRFFFFSFYTLDTGLMSRHVSPLAWVHFCPETIYFVSVQVQIILYELSLNYYPTSKIFSKNLFFGVHRTPVTPKNVKIMTVSEFRRNSKEVQTEFYPCFF